MFKSLIVIHLMIREGQLDATLMFIADNPNKIAISQLSEGGWYKENQLDAFLLTDRLQYRRKVITSGDIPTIFWRAPGYSRTQKPIMCAVGKGG